MRPESKVVILALCLAVCGCSAQKALSGNPGPYVGVVRKGATRSDVERELGNPVSSRINADGTSTRIYEYEITNKPSKARAVMHGFFDYGTLGAWEFIGSEIEAVRKQTCIVTYDANDCVKTATVKAKE